MAKLFPSKTGRFTGCVSNWTTGKSFIMKEQYEKIRNYLNRDLRTEYEYLRTEYEYLRTEYEDLRYCFNNQKTHHSVWNYDIDKKQGHITPKPVEMMKNIILHSSKEGSVVLDCFVGSGSTGVACKQLKRHFIGIELDHKYCEIARKRIKEVTLEDF